jgi:hypothetical protein
MVPPRTDSTPSQTSEFEVRRARGDELEEVVRLRWIWTTDDHGATPTLSESEFVAGAAKWARDHADTHLPHIAIAPDGEIVGMAWLALSPRVIGGRLVQAVLASAAERGAEHVTVHASPASTTMYERNGFRTSPRLLFADAAIEES